MISIAVYGRKFHPDKFDSFEKVLKVAEKFSSIIFIQETFFNSFIEIDSTFSVKCSTFSSIDELPRGLDVMLSLGGDGTFLEAGTLIGNRNIPILGINLGRLGYLATASTDDIEEALTSIEQKKYKIEERSVLSATVKGMDLPCPFALNEISIQKKYLSMIKIKTYIDDTFLNNYWADGLIIATPTGSTAYSLSVGGPILVPGSKNFALSPIAPHNLSVRPIVIPDDVTIKCTVECREKDIILSLDHNTFTIKENIEIEIKKANHSLKILKTENTDYYSTLREKLLWGIDKRNK